LQDEDERLAFVVNIQLKGIDVHTTASILIPSPTKDGWTNIKRIDKMNKANPDKEFNCLTIPRVMHRIGYTISWNIIPNG
jgi:hypothetical protein